MPLRPAKRQKRKTEGLRTRTWGVTNMTCACQPDYPVTSTGDKTGIAGSRDLRLVADPCRNPVHA